MGKEGRVSAVVALALVALLLVLAFVSAELLDSVGA